MTEKNIHMVKKKLHDIFVVRFVAEVRFIINQQPRSAHVSARISALIIKMVFCLSAIRILLILHTISITGMLKYLLSIATTP